MNRKPLDDTGFVTINHSTIDMVYLFYGDNSYLMREKVRAFEAKYRSSQGADAIIEKLDGDSLTKTALMEAVFALSFFSTKKLVEITNLLSTKGNSEIKEFIVKNLGKIPDDTVVIFTEEGKPDQRTALFKALNKPKSVQVFDNLQPFEVSNWAKKRIEERGGKIAPDALQRLASYAGSDMWRLAQEIEKLALYRSSQSDNKITVQDIETFVPAENNESVFDFIDALANKNQTKAVKLAHRLLDSGENEQYLLSMMVYQYRQLLIIADLLSKKVPVNTIASEARIHPFVVKKSLPIVQRTGWRELTSVYQKIEDCDAAIKGGELESGLALDLLLLDICRK